MVFWQFTSWEVSLQSEWSENPLSTDFWLNWPLIAVFGGASLATVGEQSDQEEDFHFMIISEEEEGEVLSSSI